MKERTFELTKATIQLQQEIEEHRMTEDELRKSQVRMAEAQKLGRLGSWDMDLFTGQLTLSDELCQILAIQAGEFDLSLEGILEFIHPDDRDQAKKVIEEARRSKKPFEYRYRIVRKDGSERILQGKGETFSDAAGNPIKLIGIAQDITEMKKAEEEKEKIRDQLLQSQKLEAIGILAGGVAHDFNNLLTTIQGYASMALRKVNGQTSLSRDLRQVLQSTERAANLTRQLLLFSRKQPTRPHFLDLNDIIDNLLKMLTRLIGEDIILTIAPKPDLWSIWAEEGAIEQVIVNLVVNSRDAMPRGGQITIRTENMALDEEYSKMIPEARPGQFTGGG
ncbi:MAG: PAS domain-containing protein [bacterium]